MPFQAMASSNTTEKSTVNKQPNAFTSFIPTAFRWQDIGQILDLVRVNDSPEKMGGMVPFGDAIAQ